MKNRLSFLLIFILTICNAQVSDFKTIDFTKADNIAKLNKDGSLENLPVLVHKLTSKLTTDVEKFRAIYTWVCTNIRGDYKQQNKVKKSRENFKNDSIGYLIWNSEFKKTVFKKLLNQKKTICTGYAYLIKEMCFIANIESVIIDGYGRSFETNVEKLESANHSWNAVKLNNKWYLCDATWSSGYMINGQLFIQEYNDGYFLTDPILFAKNHFPIQKKWFLNDDQIKAKFRAEPIVYGETFSQKTIPISPKKLVTTINKNEEINFKFKYLKSINTDEISLIQISGADKKPYKIYDLKNENGIISFKCKFKSNGFYDVHLNIKNDIVATYTIEVIKT
ncbi:transglutaminase domain-containing protein [Winogradskyella bathintestinalis]|uniref:Transglutaminase domain-containing protein n=1 Tax=Winogradskyella bathintestinalis TaxID=3035208 RepID=A0ABT7ZU54_9FLAO|nr:transglutaminase domain-containing protein [Winogradskyella bathintestinalis]MDN3492520.1 transglutaminase domain-containing protein [Winogradskyella bathintestinalis]